MHRASGSYAARAVKRKLMTATDRERRARSASLRTLGETLSTGSVADYAGPESLRELCAAYRPGGFETIDNKVPLFWWTTSENYGDLLSPWLVGKMTRHQVTFATTRGPHYLAIGSIAGRARRNSIVWGSGMAGSEPKWFTKVAHEYRAVRGPLSRALLRNVGISCPRVYGDPALLTPLFFWPEIQKTHEVGVVVRWSEDRWRDLPTGPGVKLLDFGTSDVEGITRALMACKKVVSSSLHGLIMADAYGIPNAWIDSDSWVGGSRPAGGEFKFYDYMLSVGKVRHSQTFDVARERLTIERLRDRLTFDERPITFDYEALLDASPFVQH